MTQVNLPRTYDLIIYGATGFTGRQCAAYLHQHAPRGLRWALAGRHLPKLESLAQQYHRPVVYAEASDRESVDMMCAQTKVILSTAGPFALYSDLVVELCVTHQTHYLDITGETPWARELIDRFHVQAQDQNTQLIPCCGFDSVPSDLGVWLLSRLGQDLQDVDACFTLKGGLNGGTVASAISMAERGENRKMSDRTLLCPSDHRLPPQPKDPRSIKWDDLRGQWLAPFVMAPINTRVVRRTASLLELEGEESRYGVSFRYMEWIPMKQRWRAQAYLLLLGLFEGGLKRRWGRAVIRMLTPSPGQGPSESVMNNGQVRVHFLHRKEREVIGELTLTIKGDPGNRVTVQAVCEAALALLNGEHLNRGGVLTPVTAFGDHLWKRLEARGWSADYSSTIHKPLPSSLH